MARYFYQAFKGKGIANSQIDSAPSTPRENTKMIDKFKTPQSTPSTNSQGKREVSPEIVVRQIDSFVSKYSDRWHRVKKKIFMNIRMKKFMNNIKNLGPAGEDDVDADIEMYFKRKKNQMLTHKSSNGLKSTPLFIIHPSSN